MNIPKSWNQIKVDQFIELHNLEEEGLGSLFLYQLESLAILTDEDADEIDITPNELIEILNSLSWVKNEPRGYSAKLGGLSFRPFTFLTLGEFIDLEHYFSEDYINNLPTICAILYRHTKTDEWGNVVYEPYKFIPQDRAALFLELPITDVYGIIQLYLKFRADFIERYSFIFNPEIDGEDEMDEEDKQAEHVENKWSWEMLLYSLSGEDITKVDHITDLPLVFVFNFLAMKYETKS
jgi:hypothetical protein